MSTKTELEEENKNLKKKILKLLGVMRRARLFTRKQHEELKKLFKSSLDTSL